MKRIVLALAVTVLVACGPAWNGDPSSCEYVVAGACFRGGASPAEAERLIAPSLGFWGGSPSTLDGYLVTIHVAAFDCYGDILSGCANLWSKRIDVAAPLLGCPLRHLPHEIGHVVLGGDVAHLDSRWEYVVQFEAALCP